jgi:hypothetical protein
MEASGNRHEICPGQLVTLIWTGTATATSGGAGVWRRIPASQRVLEMKTMTISVQRLVVTAALLLVGVAASARAQGIETVTNVPFAFTAGDTNLPRDRYRISPMPGHNGVFMIRGERHGVVLMSRTDRRNDREPAPRLTFIVGDRALPP